MSIFYIRRHPIPVSLASSLRAHQPHHASAHPNQNPATTASPAHAPHLLIMSDANKTAACKNLVAYGIGDEFEGADPTLIGTTPEKIVEYGDVGLWA